MTEDAPLREALDALDLPADTLRKWLEDRKTWCETHGGRRRYADLLDLLEECLETCSRTAIMS